MRRLEYTAAPQDAGRTVGALLTARLHLSRHRVSSLKFSGGILLDGESAHTNVRVRAGQVISAVLEDGPFSMAAYRLRLTVPYQDVDLLVVDKPAPLAAIHSARQDACTLENAVYAHLGCPPRFAYRPVSRLDKGTSGLMPVALNAHMHHRMQQLLHTPEYVREYLAVTQGEPPADAGVIDAPIAGIGGVRRGVRPDGRRAVTHYWVLRRCGNGRALVRLRLETGRTHQIRVHLCHLGCPVAGDYLYGQPLAQLPGRFALHAAHVDFAHPLTGERVALDSPLPRELAALMEK